MLGVLALRHPVAQAAGVHLLALRVVRVGFQHAQRAGAPEQAALGVKGLAPSGAGRSRHRCAGGICRARGIALKALHRLA